jgi:hypothetical protein
VRPEVPTTKFPVPALERELAMHLKLWHAVIAGATTKPAHADQWLALAVVIGLAVWLAFLTYRLLDDVKLLMYGIKLKIVVTFLVGIPVAAVLVAIVKIL